MSVITKDIFTTALSTRATIKDEISQARKTAVAFLPEERLMHAMSITFRTMAAYWNGIRMGPRKSEKHCLRPLPATIELTNLSTEALELAQIMGEKAAGLDVPNASYAIGALYTGTMPKERRSKLGAYYTPPALCERLLDMATETGIDWNTARVLDPACGGGAFLSPVVRRMVANMKEIAPATVLESVENRLHGIELDPFAAWLSHVFLDAMLLSLGVTADRRHQISVQVGNTLEMDHKGEDFDLVVGNPPYGRISLSPQQRQKYGRSLYGHANLYGLFTDQALRLTRIGGTVAYVTPTSFLSGAYFKALRGLLGCEAPPASIDFITERKGVFEDVLQETALTVYQREVQPDISTVRFTSVNPDGSIETSPPGSFRLPPHPENPWLIPRIQEHDLLAHRVETLAHRLSDYGYEASTGPLVWNRHKTELRVTLEDGRFPLIWAESVRPGGLFEFPVEQGTRQPYFEPNPEQTWLVTRGPCVLLRRTTAKEDDRRLLAAELPSEFDAEHGGVVVENHLNVIRPQNGQPVVSAGVIAALLNSNLVDQIFRCINGSVAVSAYELEALPLPPPETMHRLEGLVNQSADRQTVECEVERLYGGATE